MDDKIIRTLDRGYYIVESDTRDCLMGGVSGWISYWINDPTHQNVETFSSVQRAVDWWDNQDMNKDKLNVKSNVDQQIEKEAKSLVRQMGLKWDSLSLEDKEGWINECTD